MFKEDIDALVMVVPLYGDTNEKKINELYKDVIKNFNKQIPVLMLHNKLDLFVDFLNKDSFDGDPLSMDNNEDAKAMDFEKINEAIQKREYELRKELQDIQSKARKNLEIKSLSCYLKRDKHMLDKLVQKYNVIHSYEQIFRDVAEYLKDSAYKITLEVKQGEEIAVYVKDAEFEDKIKKHIKEPSTDKKVFSPGLADLTLSIGKTPHGNGYNALCRRLKIGEGYTSNIQESRFYNCSSFSINFTANMRNFVTAELLHDVVYNTIDICGVSFRNQNDYAKFVDIIKNNVNPKRLVSALLYDKAIQEAEEKTFSFRGRFQNFLQNSMKYFNITIIDEQQYIDALKKIIIEAAEKAMALNVTLK